MTQPILTHGGDWYGFQAEHGDRPFLDFSANVSPLGMPSGVQLAIRAAIPQADRYPDPLCRSLRDALAAHCGVPAEWILCGNGAADLIWRAVLALHPRRALVTAPAFAEYEAALAAAGCRVDRYLLRSEQDFALDEGFLARIRHGVDLVFLCQPNNPTGVAVPRPLLYRIAEKCRAVGARLILDACFTDFMDDPETASLQDRLADWPWVLELRAFTKLYAMAGVRLGWCLCADTRLLARMQACGQPWAVSALAQAAGEAALEEQLYVTSVRALILSQRGRLADGLRALGLRVVPGQANFLLFQSPVPLLEPLRQKGILLRSCGNYTGLDDSWYRCAVRTGPENDILLQALEEVLRHGN